MQSSTAALRIFGDELLPEDISGLLGCEPSSSYLKGDLVSQRPGATAVRKYGMWSLKVEDCEPESFDTQIQTLLSLVSDDLNVWRDLGARFEVDLFFGFFMNLTNQGFSLSKDSMTELASRGISVGFDIYAPLAGEDSNSQQMASSQWNP